MPAPEGFIMPTLGTSVGANVLKAVPTAEVIAGAMGTLVAEIKRYGRFSKRMTLELETQNLPGEALEEIELAVIQVDKLTKVPFRCSSLTYPKRKFTNELSVPEQISLAELRERFRKNEHGADTPIANWDALNASEMAQLMQIGIYYVEQLAAYQEHEYYRLGNGGAELVKRAQRHVGAKAPNKQEEFEKSMATLLAAKAEERERADVAEKRMYEMQERLAALEAPKRGPGRPPKAGIQETNENA